jgi:hypothetical protein|tara:strand:- start:953 stop:1126 length:174 start_codon:yes stop_codon:yes gene_type:complete
MKFYIGLFIVVVLTTALWPSNSPPKPLTPKPIVPPIGEQETAEAEIEPPAVFFRGKG